MSLKVKENLVLEEVGRQWSIGGEVGSIRGLRPNGGKVVCIYTKFSNGKSASSYFIGIGKGQIIVSSTFACIKGKDTAHYVRKYRLLFRPRPSPTPSAQARLKSYALAILARRHCDHLDQAYLPFLTHHQLVSLGPRSSRSLRGYF